MDKTQRIRLIHIDMQNLKESVEKILIKLESIENKLDEKNK